MPVKSRDWGNVEFVDNVDNPVEKYYGRRISRKSYKIWAKNATIFHLSTKLKIFY